VSPRGILEVTVRRIDTLTDADEWRSNLAVAIDWWSSLVESLDDDHLSQPIGAVGGPYGDGPRAGFVIHLKNEAVHHGAEVGVLRDLWRAGLR
jgi:hypothetical protein